MSSCIRDNAQITTIKVVALGLRNPAVSVPRNGEDFDDLTAPTMTMDHFYGPPYGPPMDHQITPPP